MHLKALTVRNFRVLEDISVEFDQLVSVIVGPNAIGKTTILESIRFAKALLAPRTAGETSQMMNSLGITSPHTPQLMSFDSVSRDKAKPLEVRCRYELSAAEILELKARVSEIATSLVQGQLGQAFGNPAAVIQYLSSDEGQKALQSAERTLSEYLVALEAEPSCNLDLVIDPSGSARGVDALAQIVVGVVDRWQQPSRTTFSYFPADRALPSGEVAVQIGGPDTSQQLESHNAQPQIKYSRLKNTIFNIVVQSDDGRAQLQSEFEQIFKAVLKGRQLESVGLNDRGLLSIRVIDTSNGQTFDIDSMSSGEKGLILTFLLMSRSMAHGGLLLLDEPELHLNPAVCKDVLGFLVEQYAKPNDVQAIICTHSPEILAGALDRDDCALYHLRSEKSITKVRIRDEDEVADALQRLGSSQSEGLLFRGTVFVEGPDDVDTLEHGFEPLLRRYQVKDLGGRSEVEKQIVRLQAAESSGHDIPLAVFIFDQDNAPTTLKSSKRVKILQWKRRMLENYLIDIDALTDLVTDEDIVALPLQNFGEVSKLARTLAFEQLNDTAVRDVYSRRNYESPGLRKSEIQGNTVAQSAQILFDRLVKIRADLDSIDETTWIVDFTADVEKRRTDLDKVWDTKWVELCDGKRLFADLQRTVKPRMSPQKFKRQIVQRMQVNRAESWSLMDALLREALD